MLVIRLTKTDAANRQSNEDHLQFAPSLIGNALSCSRRGNPDVDRSRVIRDDERSDPVEIKLVESGPLWVQAMRQELSAKGCSSSVEF